MLQPAAPAGRDTSTASPPPPVSPGVAQPAAPPPGGAPGGGGLLGNLVVMAPILIMVVVLFFVSRADRKKRTNLEAQLKKGDRVLTRSGLVGTLTTLGERTVRVEIAPGVTVTMLKSAIEGLDGGDTVTSAKADDKDKAKDDDKSAADSKKKK
jgi:preprotein translocase subunit YajC